MTTPSRKLWHTAKASLTVFTAKRGAGYKNSLFQCFEMFCIFFLQFLEDRQTDRQTDRPPDLGIKAPSRSLKKNLLQKLRRCVNIPNLLEVV